MNKLIKISDTHYVIVDDSEIKKGDFKICLNDKAITRYLSKESIESDTFCKDCKKITYSTKPLESTKTVTGDKLVFYKIKSIPLSKVEEAINGYSVEKMAEEKGFYDSTEDNKGNKITQAFIEGFKAHQELSKDKLFTLEDIENVVSMCKEIQLEYKLSVGYTGEVKPVYTRKEIIKSLLPKTEWDIEFANNKIQLV